MQLCDGADRGAQPGDLPDHEHPVEALLLFADRLIDGPAVGALGADDALGCDAQASQVQALEFLAHLVWAGAFALQSQLFVDEVAREGRVGAAGGVPDAGFEQNRFLAGDRLVLKGRLDGAGLDGFPGEQVGGAQQYPDLDAAFRKRGCDGADHGGGEAVMDAAGKQNVELGRIDLVAGEVIEQDLDHLLPQHEARARPDMAAALTPLENDATYAATRVQPQQLRRGHVQIGRDAQFFELFGLIGTASRDHRKLWRALANLGELLFPQLLRYESQNADAPGAVAELLASRFEQFAHLLAAHQRQGQHRQSAAGLDRIRKLRAVAHPRHRPLNDRVGRPMRLSQWAALA